MPLTCQQATERLTSIREYLGYFNGVIDNVSTAPSLEQADRTLQIVRAMKKNLERLCQKFESELSNPFETLLGLSRQYEKQVQVLRGAGLLQTRNGVEGIFTTENGVSIETPLPTLEDITERLENKRELVEQKISQGFTKLLIVPFCRSISDLETLYTVRLYQNKRASTLFTYEKNRAGRIERCLAPLSSKKALYNELELDKNPILYYPENFSPNSSGGILKEELIRKPDQLWRILLVEDTVSVPEEGKGQMVGNRPELEAGRSPEKFLQEIKTNPVYQGEEGFTLEDWLTLAIDRLETKNEMIDDRKMGVLPHFLGCYQPNVNQVPRAWYSPDIGNGHISIISGAPQGGLSHFGVRTAVRI